MEKLLIEELQDELTSIEIEMEPITSSPDKQPKKGSNEKKRQKCETDNSLIDVDDEDLYERIELLEENNKALKKSLERVLKVTMAILNNIPPKSPKINEQATYNAPKWVTVNRKNDKPEGKSDNKPLMSEHQMNVLNSAADEINEQKRRKKNLIVFGIPISKQKEALNRKKNDEEEINKILAYINYGKKIETDIIRFKPKSETETVTPILIKFKDEKTRNEILQKAKKLREKSAYEKIYLNPDLTVAQQYNFKQLREQCKLKPRT